MRVLIVAVGSRGDVAPFTGLGTALRAAGHSVAIAGYEMFAGLVTGCGLEFRALPGDPRILEAARWQRGGTGPLGAARLVRLIGEHMREVHAGILAAARQGTDVLLLAGLSSIGGYHIAEGLGLPSIGLALAPVYPTGDFPPSIVAARSLGRWGNLAAGKALVVMGAPALAGPVRELRAPASCARTWTGSPSCAAATTASLCSTRPDDAPRSPRHRQVTVAKRTRRRCPPVPDSDAVLARLRSPDPPALLRALHSICPCAAGFPLYERFRGEVKRLQKDPHPGVRAAALHVEHDACEIEAIETGLGRADEQGWRYSDTDWVSKHRQRQSTGHWLPLRPAPPVPVVKDRGNPKLRNSSDDGAAGKSAAEPAQGPVTTVAAAWRPCRSAALR
jgi:hypothetical protein